MNKLKEYRESKGVKLVAVSDYLGVSRQTYASYEKNPDAMSIAQAKAVCSFLGCDINNIFFESKVN